MTTLAAAEPNVRVLGGLNDIPMIATDIIFEGAMVGDNGAGLARPLVAGDKFLGHCMETIDNSAGAASAKTVKVWGGMRYRMSVALVGVITDYNQPVYASDDGALTFFGGDGNSFIGVVTRYESATRMEIECRPGEQDEWGNRLRITKTDDFTLTAAESGVVLYLNTDAKTITVIATAEGLDFIVCCQAPFGTVLIHVDPDGSDLFLAGAKRAANADGHKASLTKATQQRNDFIAFHYGGATGFRFTNVRGTWAAE